MSRFTYDMDFISSFQSHLEIKPRTLKSNKSSQVENTEIICKLVLKWRICETSIILYMSVKKFLYEPQHDKTNKMSVRPAKTQISLGIRPVWSESSLSAWRKLGSLATH